jgi:hypothetical protein
MILKYVHYKILCKTFGPVVCEKKIEVLKLMEADNNKDQHKLITVPHGPVKLKRLRLKLNVRNSLSAHKLPNWHK